MREPNPQAAGVSYSQGVLCRHATICGSCLAGRGCRLGCPGRSVRAPERWHCAAAGNLSFKVDVTSPPANDNLASALEASPLPYDHSLTNVDAGIQGSEPLKVRDNTGGSL